MMNVLNKVEHSSEPNQDASRISQELQKFMLRLKGEFISDDGTNVNYKAMKASKLFQEYKEDAKHLNRVNLATLTIQDEKIAFFINIYNALTIHGLADRETVPDSVLDIKQFWMVTAYNIGGYSFSLDDIEHGVIRGNRGHPATKKAQFNEDDPRIKFVVKDVDPRIHFALVCGAKSCPPINVYSAANLDAALKAATKNFLEPEIITLPKCRQMYVPRLLQWYREDFGKTDVDGVRWCLPYLSADKRNQVEVLLTGLELVGQVDLLYNEYNWGLNTIM